MRLIVPDSMGEPEEGPVYISEKYLRSGSGGPVRAISGPPTKVPSATAIGTDIPPMIQRTVLGKVNQIAGKKKPKNYMVQLPSQGIYA